MGDMSNARLEQTPSGVARADGDTDALTGVMRPFAWRLTSRSWLKMSMDCVNLRETR